MISVILCTHNPRPDYLARTLSGLRSQTLPKSAWEFVLVDNKTNSPLANRVDISWHPMGRVVREDELGLTSARLRGINETSGELLVFVDDDNVLDADYLERAWSIACERPFLGAWSGQCRPAFEEPPPEWTRRYWGNLAIREFEQDVWSNLSRLPETMPCGAGLCVRRDVAARYAELHHSGAITIMLDRRGRSLFSGGDNDLAACACDLGLGVGLVASLKLSHLIPRERLTRAHLAQLAEGIYSSAVVLAHRRSSAEELAGYRVRWRDVVRALLKPSPHREIQLAVLRGCRRGARLVAEKII